VASSLGLGRKDFAAGSKKKGIKAVCEAFPRKGEKKKVLFFLLAEGGKREVAPGKRRGLNPGERGGGPCPKETKPRGDARGGGAAGQLIWRHQGWPFWRVLKREGMRLLAGAQDRPVLLYEGTLAREKSFSHETLFYPLRGRTYNFSIIARGWGSFNVR